MVKRDSWELGHGAEIAPGRSALRLLGGGRRYEAYLAFDDGLRTLVVAKLVRPGLVADTATIDGLTGEAHMLERLAHPFLLRGFGAALGGERPHLLLEYVDGPRLSTLLRQDGITIEQLLPLALNLCSVLNYMGTQRTVHLDVKPRNIIMGGSPRLIDLSIARTIEGLSEVRSPVGTDSYMAPEQCNPSFFEALGPATDIWGLGATLYEALAGEPPFGRLDGAKRSGQFPQLKQSVPSLPRGVPGVIADPVLACLATDPADRPTPAQLGDVLEPLVASLPAPRIGRFRPGGRALVQALERDERSLTSRSQPAHGGEAA